MKLLQSRSKIHGVVESALREDKNRTRKLWRLDKLQERLYLLILSEEQKNRPAASSGNGSWGSSQVACYNKVCETRRQYHQLF